MQKQHFRGLPPDDQNVDQSQVRRSSEDSEQSSGTDQEVDKSVDRPDVQQPSPDSVIDFHSATVQTEHQVNDIAHLTGPRPQNTILTLRCKACGYRYMEHDRTINHTGCKDCGVHYTRCNVPEMWISTDNQNQNQQQSDAPAPTVGTTLGVFRCEHCGEEFPTERKLRTHRLHHVCKQRRKNFTAYLDDEDESVLLPAKRPRLQTKTKIQQYIDDGQQPSTSTGLGHSSLRYQASQVDQSAHSIDASEHKKVVETETAEHFHHKTGKLVERVTKTKVSYTQASKRERILKQQKKNYSMYSSPIQGRMQKFEELLVAHPGAIEQVYGLGGYGKPSKSWRAEFDPENAQGDDVEEDIGCSVSEEEEDDEDGEWHEELTKFILKDPRFSSKK